MTAAGVTETARPRPEAAGAASPATAPGADEAVSAEPFRPIFVVGNPRSGTTLLAALLGRNPAIAALPETHFFRILSPAIEVLPAGSAPRLVERLARMPRLRQLDVRWAEVARRLETVGVLTPANVLRAVLESYAAERGRPRVLEKTPVHLRHLRDIGRAYPQARIVWIVRHPGGSLNSLRKVAWSSNRLALLALLWNRNVNAAFGQLGGLEDRVYRLYYEDLMAAPSATLQRLHDWLGVPFDPIQLDAAPADAIVQVFERGWKAKVSEAVDGQRAAAWRSELTPQETALILCMTRRNRRRLGYAHEPAGQLPLATNALCRIGQVIDRVLLHPRALAAIAIAERQVRRLIFRLTGWIPS